MRPCHHRVLNHAHLLSRHSWTQHYPQCNYAGEDHTGGEQQPAKASPSLLQRRHLKCEINWICKAVKGVCNPSKYQQHNCGPQPLSWGTRQNICTPAGNCENTEDTVINNTFPLPVGNGIGEERLKLHCVPAFADAFCRQCRPRFPCCILVILWTRPLSDHGHVGKQAGDKQFKHAGIFLQSPKPSQFQPCSQQQTSVGFVCPLNSQPLCKIEHR